MKIIKYLPIGLTLVATNDYTQTKSAKKATTKMTNITGPPTIVIHEEYKETELSSPRLLLGNKCRYDPSPKCYF